MRTVSRLVFILSLLVVCPFAASAGPRSKSRPARKPLSRPTAQKMVRRPEPVDRIADHVLLAIDQTNRARVKAGLAPLKPIDALSAAATAHARDMAKRGFFDHRSPEGEGPDERCRRVGYPTWLGENLYMGAPEASAAVEAWMRSPGHRANILNSSATEVGVGVALTPDGRAYWVQIVGTP